MNPDESKSEAGDAYESDSDDQAATLESWAANESARYDGSILICLSDLAMEAAATLNATADQRATLKSALETAQCEYDHRAPPAESNGIKSAREVIDELTDATEVRAGRHDIIGFVDDMHSIICSGQKGLSQRATIGVLDSLCHQTKRGEGSDPSLDQSLNLLHTTNGLAETSIRVGRRLTTVLGLSTAATALALYINNR